MAAKRELKLKPSEILKQSKKFCDLARNASNEKERDRFLRISDALYDKWLADRRFMFEQRIEEKSGNLYEWLNWAKSLYPIEKTENGFTVKSNARKWKKDTSWVFDHEIDCLEKIEKLIGYKINDRKRGRGNVEEDLILS